MKIYIIRLSALLVFICSSLYSQTQNDTELLEKTASSKVIEHKGFESQYVDNRNIEVYLPSGYNPDSNEKLKVLYVHDGQNVFNPKTSYTGIDWGIDEILDSLIHKKTVEKTVVVAIWNNGKKRFSEYMPKSPEGISETEQAKKGLKDFTGIDHLLSDEYLNFVVKELKPFIDKNYNVSQHKDDTTIMGASMGGLISLYAICKYPDVFGSAICMSTHWPVPILGPAYIESLKTDLPNPKDHKIYFDFGTESLDAQYEPYQNQVDDIMKNAGYTEGENWMTQKFEGASHNEESWNKRVHIPLEYMLQ